MIEKTKTEKRIKTGNIVIVLLSLALVVVAIFYVYKNLFGCSKKYDFINSKLACSGGDYVDKKSYKFFVDDLNKYINKEKEEGKVDVVSVFFRDLESGPVFGINENEYFVPASLLKLPTVLTLIRLSESDPEVLDKNLEFEGEYSSMTQTFVYDKKIEENVPYKIDDLIYYSLAYSDNLADEMIYEYLVKLSGGNLSLIDETYRDLGLFDANSTLFKESVTPKGYSSIFRLLYNTSFLNDKNSEKVLSILSQSTFVDGLRKGVPDNIRIAHKFGERFSPSGKKQLHDCGIIYYPKNPYLLCIMTEGEDFQNLAEIIGTISKKVYEEFDSRKI